VSDESLPIRLTRALASPSPKDLLATRRRPVGLGCGDFRKAAGDVLRLRRNPRASIGVGVRFGAMPRIAGPTIFAGRLS